MIDCVEELAWSAASGRLGGFGPGVLCGVDWVDWFFEGSAETALLCNSSLMSSLLKKSQASVTRSGLCKDITPTVKWIAPTGRKARAGIFGSSFVSVLETSATKRERVACSCGRETDVERGRQRKCVKGGLAGIAEVVGGGQIRLEAQNLYMEDNHLPLLRAILSTSSLYFVEDSDDSSQPDTSLSILL